MSHYSSSLIFHVQEAGDPSPCIGISALTRSPILWTAFSVCLSLSHVLSLSIAYEKRPTSVWNFQWSPPHPHFLFHSKIAGRNINHLRNADGTTLKAENEEELKSFLMKVEEESEKADLKFNIQKIKIMA